MMLGAYLVAVVCAFALASAVAVGCADTSNGERRVTVVKNRDIPPPMGGIPPDKEQDIQLMLQQREPSTLKCYEDVLNDKHDRAFKGTVMVMLTIEPSGKASNVRIAGGTLNNKEVTDCLVEKLKDFEYPQIPNQGTMQYVYKFEPAY
jgi:hypothetical protein